MMYTDFGLLVDLLLVLSTLLLVQVAVFLQIISHRLHLVLERVESLC